MSIKVLTADESGADSLVDINANFGKVIEGPSSSTDNAIARFDSTTGKLLQNSVLTVTDIISNGVTITTPDVAGVPTTLFVRAGGSTNSDGGAMSIQGGYANAGNNVGGGGYLDGGVGFGSGAGRESKVTGGTGGATGAGGSAIVQGGAGGATSGNGGFVHVKAGNATNGNSNGGNIYIIPGNKTGSGAIGHTVIYPNEGAAAGAILELSNIASSDKTFTFPNATGQFGMITTGAGVPTGTAPGAAFIFYYDTTNNKLYISKGT